MALVSRFGFGTIAILVLAYYFADLKTHFFPPNSPIVTTKNGAVQGIVQKSREGKEYLSYLGIPYATPPIGELRFQAPEPPLGWQGLRPANKFGNDCYQYAALTTGRIFGSEDCLFLNVHTGNVKGNFPVMVWIHGGGFLEGSAKLYNPKYFMDHDIVIVTLNYRLGALGFLNTGDDLISGNMGLKDQSMALKWVQENIKEFGGDASKVTIFGESAGGASVHYHILSPLSRGLFSRAISQSGVVQCPWALTRDAKNQAKHFGKKMKCRIGNSKEIVECLKKKDAYDLVLTTASKFSPVLSQDDMLVGSMEARTVNNPFLSKYPHAMMTTGDFAKVPWMLGVVSGEGGLKTSRVEAMEEETNLDDQWEKYAPILAHYDPKKKSVTKKIREFYFNDQTYRKNGAEFLTNFTRMMGDTLFAHPVTTAAALHVKHAPVYLYYYNYNATTPTMYSILRAMRPNTWILSELKFAMAALVDTWKKYVTPDSAGPHNYGPCHSDDLIQQWVVNPLLEIGKRNYDLEFSKKFVQVLVDFASAKDELSFGGVRWETTKADEPQKFMQMEDTGRMVGDPFGGRMNFWDALGDSDAFKIRDPYEPKNW